MTLSDVPDQGKVSERISIRLRDGRTLELEVSVTSAPSVGRGGGWPKPPVFLAFTLDSGELVSIRSEPDFLAAAPSVGREEKPA